MVKKTIEQERNTIKSIPKIKNGWILYINNYLGCNSSFLDNFKKVAVISHRPFLFHYHNRMYIFCLCLNFLVLMN